MAELQNDRYQIVERIEDPDGLVAVITEQRDTGRMSFAVFREFERGGRTCQTAYVQTRHIAAYRRLLDDLEVRAEELEDRARAAKRKCR